MHEKEIIKKNMPMFLDYTKHYSDSETDKKFKKILGEIEDKSSVLILGCGAGREIEYLLKKKCKITALDISQELIEYCRKRYRKKANILCVNALDFKTEEKFDYIIGLWAFINFIPWKKEREELMINLKNMLKKEGEIIFTIRKPENLMDWVKIFIWSLKSRELGTVYARGPEQKKDTPRIPYKIFRSNREIIKLGELSGLKTEIKKDCVEFRGR
jgi:SAM-dependent methyltransferase